MKLLKEIVTLDFETAAIGPRPKDYPPKPVGLAIRWADGRTEYLAWGHPTGNNCGEDAARRALRLAYQGPVLFHNAAFDMEVAYEHMGVPFPHEWHDTLLLLFLNNPHAMSFSLKPSAMLLLGEPPDEQDKVKAWILANVPGATGKNFGAHISKAPVGLVKPYAIGDVERTYKLFRLLAPSVMAEQGTAYTREKALLPYLLDAERRGIRADREVLNTWFHQLDAAVLRCDQLIRLRLNAPGLNLDSNDELADALERQGLVSHWILADGTKTKLDGTAFEDAGATDDDPVFPVSDNGRNGNATVSSKSARSMARPVLQQIITDKEALSEIVYRNTAATMLRTFINPWLAMSATDGRLHTKWHQVRGQEKNGTRTGRVASSDPNLANVMNPVDATPPFGLPFLPALRTALLPEPGHVWMSADYSQQELRLAAHYEDGQIQFAYQQTPNLDLHQLAQELILRQTGLKVERKKTKTVAFATIYGAGIPQLSSQMGVSAEEAYAVREAYFAALPGLLSLINRVKAVGRTEGRIKTLGGRMIPLEAPRMIKGKLRSFEYKLANHLIQGSAADQTKQAIIDFCGLATGYPFMSQVYDELNISVPNNPQDIKNAAGALSRSMINALPLDVPMLVDVEVGPTWGGVQAYKPGEPQ